MEVRDTELDQFSVVNNNVYGYYMQHGRHKALKALGAGVGEYQARGILMALSELSIKYKTPLRSGDVFRVDTSVEQVTAARLVMRQAVVREDAGGRKLSLCAEGLATVVFLDTAYRPIRLPAGEKAVFEALRQQAAAAAGGNGTD
ncbi:hypothetical protein MNEG_8262 [Monoraphidium neglectum]|uniref:Thioesterase domain-containing protein n=1 Tax=Monoraphidium neglectum TaxID=145388 RepID=A0A0D2JKD1_9CHLO|nr:hypothetical protein MNEG_8262 [Monoraphidium neglectum]KIY99702.1 hypothetical protein MNEG_8262 [Monoraphidium neglectum]|eukprot:XP_013898722.1 hypothetical protein MNEG_8262 [Monoraphidium neglectum]